MAANKVVKKLMAVWKKMPDYLKKDGRNSFHKYNYLSEAKIKSIIMPLLREAGILFKADVTDYNITFVGEKADKPLTTIKIHYQFIDSESGEVFEGSIVSQGIDSGDKGVFKAVTGGIKYIFMDLFLIPTGDDPEKDDSAPTPTRKRSTAKPSSSALQKAKEETIEAYRRLAKIDASKANEIAKSVPHPASVKEYQELKKAFEKALADEKEVVGAAK